MTPVESTTVCQRRPESVADVEPSPRWHSDSQDSVCGEVCPGRSCDHFKHVCRAACPTRGQGQFKTVVPANLGPVVDICSASIHGWFEPSPLSSGLFDRLRRGRSRLRHVTQASMLARACRLRCVACALFGLLASRVPPPCSNSLCRLLLKLASRVRHPICRP